MSYVLKVPANPQIAPSLERLSNNPTELAESISASSATPSPIVAVVARVRVSKQDA